MRSTLVSLGFTDYPKSRYRIIAIPNSDDIDTIGELRRLQEQFPFLEVMEVPPTDSPQWDVVWNAWERNPKAYWFHRGGTRAARNLPPKKTRQLIFMFYNLVNQIGTDWMLDYIDADSMPPADHFRIAARGFEALRRAPIDECCREPSGFDAGHSAFLRSHVLGWPGLSAYVGGWTPSILCVGQGVVFPCA